MKKIFILGASVVLLSQMVFAETIYLYKQTDSNTIKVEDTVTSTENTVTGTENTVKATSSKNKVYKVKPNKTNKSNFNTTVNSTGVENSSTDSLTKLKENQNGTNLYDANDSSLGVTTSESLNKKSTQNNRNQNRIKNTFGKNSDYITAPSNNDGDSLERMNRLIAKINDPYVIKIDGIKYYLVKNSSVGKYSLNNIVGYGDSKNSLFEALKSLNLNDDKKLTKDELQKAGVRFVAVGIDGKLKLNDSSNDFTDILYIDLSNTRESVNKGDIGSFGYYDVYINKNGITKKIIGYVSFDSDDELLEMIK